jgi:hypothetical protein
MLDMSSIMPIFTTESEIPVFSSDFVVYAATNKNTADATITSHLFIVTSWVVDAFTLDLKIIDDDATRMLAAEFTAGRLEAARREGLI